MKIKKTFQGSIPENKILNSNSTSQTDTYSCEKINEMTEDVYSTEETRIGTWINGKPLYRKVVEFGTLPNATQEGVEIGSGLQIKKIYGYCYRSSDNTIFPIPYVSVSNIAYCIQTTVSNNVLYIKTSDNWSELTGTIILEYTKTTD